MPGLWAPWLLSIWGVSASYQDSTGEHNAHQIMVTDEEEREEVGDSLKASLPCLNPFLVGHTLSMFSHIPVAWYEGSKPWYMGF